MDFFEESVRQCNGRQGFDARQPKLVENTYSPFKAHRLFTGSASSFTADMTLAWVTGKACEPSSCQALFGAAGRWNYTHHALTLIKLIACSIF